MANKKIRITFFWSDEAAVVQDFRAKHTQKQVDWANDFFGKYGMELDVQPALGGKVADAYPYCLVKSGGYDPDLATFDDVIDRWRKARVGAFVAWGRLFGRLNQLKDEEREKRPLVDAARAALAALPANDPGRPAAEAQLNTLLIEYLAVTQEIAAKEPELQKLEAELEAIDATTVAEQEEREFWTVPRRQLGDKILASVPFSAITKIKAPAENAYIFSDRRLKVLNARFRLSPGVLQFRGPGNKHFGVTLPDLGFNRLNGKYLWDGPLIMINLLKFEQITLAHETVHASGRSHIDPRIRHKSIPSFISQIRQDFATGKLIIPSIYEYEELYGYRDGPKDDIVNYNAKSKKAEDVKLYPDDQKAMEEAFFVAPSS